MKPLASLSLDLDNKWSYLKTHGDPGWEAFPSYLDIVVPRFLNFFEERNTKITVFVVGQDAAIERNHDALASISEAGHEIGNHSYHHEPWLHLYSIDQIDEELARTEEHLERVTGQCPIGFRGPGFSLSDDVLRVLSRRGYEYDCSTFPTFLGPLARLYYFMTAKLDEKQKNERKKLFGTFSEGFKSLRPYCWNITDQSVSKVPSQMYFSPRPGNPGRGAGGEGPLLGTPSSSQRLLEIPVTTMPLFKVPIHVSYLLYLDQFSRALAMSYWHVALTMCRINNVAPSLLLHPLDFMGCDDDSDLSFFPAMRVPHQRKVELVGKVINSLARYFHLVPMRDHARDVMSRFSGEKHELTRSQALPGNARG